MEWILLVAVLIIALLIFCLWKSYNLGFKLGYKTGAEQVLNEWKQYMKMEDDE
jgi:hypothetical protein